MYSHRTIKIIYFLSLHYQLAVIIHKVAEALTLGMALKKSDIPLQQSIFLIKI